MSIFTYFEIKKTLKVHTPGTNIIIICQLHLKKNHTHLKALLNINTLLPTPFHQPPN